MRIIFLFAFMLLFSNGFAQTDSITLAQQRVFKERLNKVQKWEDQLGTARKSGDLYNEMIGLMDLIRFQLKESYDLMASYKNALYLEKLVNKNPESRGSKEISELLFKEIGSMMQSQGNFDGSIPYFNKSIEASKLNEDKTLYFDTRVRLIHSLSETGNRQKALDIFQLTEKEAIKNKDSLLLTRLYASLAITYIRESNYQESLKFAKKSIYQKAPANSRAFRNMLVGQSYIQMNKPDSALIYAETSLKIASEYHLTKEKEEIHQVLLNIYEALGNYEKAFYHFDMFYNEQGKHKSFENAILIGNLNAQKELERTNLQQALAEEKLSNQKIIIWLVSGSLILLLIGVIYIFNRLKFISRQNIIIAKEKLRAEQSERYKEQFLANMSHEIRTPMNAISGMTNNLLRNKHPKNQDPYLEAMKTSSDNLLVLLNDILDLSKIESGKLEIEHEQINPTNVVKDVIQVLHFKSSEKGLELKSEIEPTFPQEIIGDASRLTQILINLVGNAIKFTETGSITIKLSKIDDTIRFSIIDTGIGIDSEKLEMIFDNFEQGDSSKSQIYGGTGLGLSISKRLVELQNGKIWVESILGKGSTFIFELQIQQEISNKIDNKNLNKTDLQSICKELDGIRILIVDDDEFNIMIVKDDLNYFIENTTLSVAENGKKAVELFKQNRFDIILMDMHMPIMNGCEATEIIRTLEIDTKNRIPIIAMTANIIKSEIDKCIASGMDAYIPKPYKSEELVIKIHEMVK